jgi:hypothetical protein
LDVINHAVEQDQRYKVVGAAKEFAQLLPREVSKDIYATGKALFNTIRWRSRFAIVGLTTASALLAGIPVLYHLVWMIVPKMERPF